jgi:hypothetical protein
MIDHNSLMCLESIAVFLPDKIVFKPDALVMMIVVFTSIQVHIAREWLLVSFSLLAKKDEMDLRDNMFQVRHKRKIKKFI